MQINVVPALDEEQLDQAWALYASAFEQLRYAAVQRHLMYRHEFDEVMRDARVSKYLALDSVRIAGLATFSNELDAMPLISPDYFARRWPNEYADKRVWYLGFFAVDHAYRGTGVFDQVIAKLWAQVRAHGGVAGLDVCDYNTALGLPAAIQRTLQGLTPQVITERADTQTFWCYILPTAT